jgi:uracil-DNA glycosylase
VIRPPDDARAKGRTLTAHAAKRIANDYLASDDLIAVKATHHPMGAWVVSYVERARPTEMLDGGGLLVTDEGEVLSVGSAPGDIERVLSEHYGWTEAVDLSPEDEADVWAVRKAAYPWGHALPELPTVPDRDSTIPPRGREVMALLRVPLRKVRVVIVGLDPYPNPDHATGLAFSVDRDVWPLPRALNSIHEAMRYDEITPPRHGDLGGWAAQGVLLLNRALTHDLNRKAGAHLAIWKPYTDAVMKAVSDRPGPPVVFVLWGRRAQQVGRLIDARHTIITAPHPSSRGRYRKDFIKSRTFTKVNAALAEPIDWAAD